MKFLLRYKLFKIINDNLKLFLILFLIYIIVWQILLNIPLNPLNIDLNLKENMMNGKMSNKLERKIYETSSEKPIKIFCLILTCEKKLFIKAQLVHNTWAKKCDNHKFILKLPNSLKVIDNKVYINDTFLDIDVSFLLQPPGLVEDVYKKLTDKVFHTFKHINLHFNNYDWYLKADDDTFIFVDNLRKFLSKKNTSEPVTYGYNFKKIVKHGYHSGGAGYVLSNEAMNRIGSKLNENYKFCQNRGFEDIDVGACLRLLNVLPGESIDDKGKERFHPLNLRAHYYGTFPKWMERYSSHKVEKGLRCCSDESISFHYVKPNDFSKLHEIVTNHENDKDVCKKELRFIDIVHQLIEN